MSSANENNAAIDYTEKELRERLCMSTTAFRKPENQRGYPKPTPEMLSSIKNAGIDYIELIEIRDQYDLENPQEVRELHETISDAGIQVVSLHCCFSCLKWETEEEHTRELDRSKRQIDATLMMGARFWSSHTRIEHPTAKKGFEELLRYAEGKDVTLAIENFPWPEQTVANNLAFIRDIDHPQLGMLLDTGHCLNSDGPQPMTVAGRAGQIVRDCGSDLVHTHLSDFKFSETERCDHFAPFDGDIQWVEVMRALKEIGYKGYFNFEQLSRSFAAVPDTLSKIGSFPEELCRRARALF